MEQTNQDAFGFGDFDSRYEIAVSRDYGGFLDDMLRRRHRRVDAKQTIAPLLFECNAPERPRRASLLSGNDGVETAASPF